MGKNALIVKMVLETEEMRKTVTRLIDQSLVDERKVWDLEDKVKELTESQTRQNEAILRLNKENEALRDKEDLHRRMDFDKAYDHMAVELVTKRGWLPDINDVEPFGVKENEVVLGWPGPAEKIPTIKLVRHLWNLGLKESKDIVDGWFK